MSEPGTSDQTSFAKGHGTENDFVLLVDADGTRGLSAEQVRRLCDRRAGIGADGVLRAVRAERVPEWSADPVPGLWFMDYRNADGTVAEMCGNGVRVFVAHLLEQGLVIPEAGGRVPVATRAGLRTAWVLPTGQIRVAMGEVAVGARDVTVSLGGDRWEAYRADVGNPHAVCFVEDLAALDLTGAPGWEPVVAYPEGVNVEFVHRLGPRHLAMRVHERGSGETRSCGTGTCAVAAVAAVAADDTQRPASYRVDVPGGTVEVELWTDETYLTGPAAIVAHGRTTLI